MAMIDQWRKSVQAFSSYRTNKKTVEKEEEKQPKLDKHIKEFQRNFFEVP